MIWIAVVLYVVSGVIAYGRTVHDFTYTFSAICHSRKKSTLAFGVFMALGGPIGWLVAAIMASQPFGLSFNPDTEKIEAEFWEKWRREYREQVILSQLLAEVDLGTVRH